MQKHVEKYVRYMSMNYRWKSENFETSLPWIQIVYINRVVVVASAQYQSDRKKSSDLFPSLFHMFIFAEYPSFLVPNFLLMGKICKRKIC